MTGKEIDAVLDAMTEAEIRQHAKRFLFIASNFKAEKISHKNERYHTLHMVLQSGIVTRDVDDAMEAMK
jgi:hypothetical protein